MSPFPDDLKKKIAKALLDMNQIEKWKEKLDEYNVWGFQPVEASLFNKDQNIEDVNKKLTLRPAYY